MTEEIIGWDSVYQFRPYSESEPHREVVLLSELLRAHGVRQILDLGCGDGRHLVYLARQGYIMYGLDIAFWGVRRARERLIRERLKAHLVRGDMVALPWPERSLDAVLSIQVVYHNKLAAIRKTLQEVYRILRHGGLFFATFLKYPPVGREMEEHDEIEPRTYVRREGFEQGVLHHFFTRDELEGVLCRFDLLRFEDTSTGKYYNVLAQKAG